MRSLNPQHVYYSYEQYLESLDRDMLCGAPPLRVSNMQLRTRADLVVERVLTVIPVSCECVSLPDPRVCFCRNPGPFPPESCSVKPGLDDPDDIVVSDSLTCDSGYDGESEYMT